jgi:hypothetical protein
MKQFGALGSILFLLTYAEEWRSSTAYLSNGGLPGLISLVGGVGVMADELR